ncbi:MAG: hypothetical protein KDK99_03975 [Verrucomicrobiales bacterium]|nr:hypothetical protein [Verrucomicrobiales bacterium]
MALAAVVLGSVVVVYGSLVRARGAAGELVNVQLPPVVAANFFGAGAPYLRRVPSAPDYGAMGTAERMREQFLADVTSAAAVYCLYRNPNSPANPYRRSWYSYDLATDGLIETSQDFRRYLVSKDSAAATVFLDYRNPTIAASGGSTLPPPNATIVLAGFSADPGRLGVLATYEIDVIPQRTVKPWGFYVSVRRYTHLAADPDSEFCELSGGFELFYPPSEPGLPTAALAMRNDGFSPLFVTMERRVRLGMAEGVAVDRFKRAAERPFYFVWWPDPLSRDLRTSASNRAANDPRHAYNQMGGRTSFMFTVPMYPAL